ncbi:MAG: hypothetical protein AB8U25_00180 [Rickettsiales endosymbiont of Dermacentor nuttalli]
MKKTSFINEGYITLEALEFYTLSRRLYSKNSLNDMDKARVFSRIGGIKSPIILENNQLNNKLQKEIQIIEDIFNKSYELGNKEAKLSLLKYTSCKIFFHK